MRSGCESRSEGGLQTEHSRGENSETAEGRGTEHDTATRVTIIRRDLEVWGVSRRTSPTIVAVAVGGRRHCTGMRRPLSQTVQADTPRTDQQCNASQERNSIRGASESNRGVG